MATPGATTAQLVSHTLAFRVREYETHETVSSNGEDVGADFKRGQLFTISMF